MRKIFACFVLLCFLLVSGCTYDKSKNEDLDDAYVHLENGLSDSLMLKIAENYFLTITAEFDADEEVPYSEVFNYYKYAACYDHNTKKIENELVKYYDSDTLIFSIPCEIVDDYLIGKFNTIPDRNNISCYNSQTECYEFEQHMGENYYEYSVVEKEEVSANVYSFSVEIKHSMTDIIPMELHSFVVKMYNSDYKILSHNKSVNQTNN